MRNYKKLFLGICELLLFLIIATTTVWLFCTYMLGLDNIYAILSFFIFIIVVFIFAFTCICIGIFSVKLCSKALKDIDIGLDNKIKEK